jgi:stearoyl-CoA desaturase (delta-9 desaturase)
MKLPWKKIYWTNSAFLIGTFLATVIGVPAYIWRYGLDGFQIGLFIFYGVATGLSITLGYHRLFSHLTFQARWPVKLFTLLFGAAAFEGTVLVWSADHRRHHKFTDEEDDPHDISRGFFHAHIGWLRFRTGPETPLTWVRDLQKDRLAVWQHKHYVPLALAMGFGLPTLIGYLWGGPTAALGAFLIAGAARIVFVHHMTFCINSLCHWIGKQPYSSKCTARDSLIMAFFTFGEGYHNFHHEFQYDYRNGVKPWQFDPTKWTIWLLNKTGLVGKLRRVPEEVILKAQIAERKRRLSETLSARQTPISESLHTMLHNAQDKMHAALAHWEELRAEYRAAAERRGAISRKHRKELKRRVNEATTCLRTAVREWMCAHELIYSALQAA